MRWMDKSENKPLSLGSFCSCYEAERIEKILILYLKCQIPGLTKLIAYRTKPRNNVCFSVTIFIKLTFAKANAVQNYYLFLPCSSLF